MDRGYILGSDERTRVKRRKILYVAGVIVFGVLAGTFLFWLINGQSFSSKKDQPGPGPDRCEIIHDSEKFDCHPDRPLTEKECLNRGCCYRPASDLKVSDDDLIHSSYLGVPSCYFPRDYKGYSYKLIKNDTAIKGELSRIGVSGFQNDIKKVDLDITFIDDNSLRIQLKDQSSIRYVPDLPLNDAVKPIKNPLYTLNIDNNGLLTVLRKTNNAVVFKTKLSQLIFSNQFLQLSTFTNSTYIYGLGEHKDSLLRSFNWTRITLFNQGDLPVPHRNLYGTHPFYLLVESDGSANGVFLRNTNAMDILLQPAPAVTFRTIGGILDFFVMLGPSPQDVITQYTNIVGRPAMIPYWSLGFQLCRYGYFTLDNTNETLRRNIDAGVPVDVQWHDIDYMQRHLDFTYDPDNFAGLPDWVDELHRTGRHYVAMISPGVSNTEPPNTYPAYDEGKKLDLFVKDYSGKYIESKVWNTNYSVYPDFTNPKTENYWIARFEEFHKELKFDGVWLDMNEPLNFDNGTVNGCPQSPLEDPSYLPGKPYPLRTLTICMTAKHISTIHYNEHNLLGIRESKATYSAMTKITNKRPFLISRATYAGQGAYSGHWSGDITSNYEDMRYTIPFMLVFNMYGMPMVGSDICGFRENTTMDLCARWQALGAFYPFSRNHNDFDTVDQDPAAMGGIVLEATKKALYTRYYLLPYFYYLFYRSSVFGETTVRPLFFEFPSDPVALKIDQEFLWGPAILIIPALYPNVTEVNAYFPNSLWYDFNTGVVLSNKAQYKKLPCNETHINVAVRGGYVLPLQLPGDTVTASRENQFDILVALDKNQEASGQFYWDDGDSLDTREKGSYDLSTFRATKNSFNHTVITHGYRSKLDMGSIKIYGVNKEPKIKGVIINKTGVEFVHSETVLTIDAKNFSLKEDLIVTWA